MIFGTSSAVRNIVLRYKSIVYNNAVSEYQRPPSVAGAVEQILRRITGGLAKWRLVWKQEAFCSPRPLW